ncbi:MAG: nitronate monooxygenase family protein [Ginsengibacter sp.]
MEWNNELTKVLKIKYPIIQAPMLGVTTPEMVAAISNQGGLGSLPVGGLSPEKTVALIRKTKALTAAPFAVNLFTNSLPLVPPHENYDLMQDLLQKVAMENGFHFEKRSPALLKFYPYTEQVALLISESIPIVSFTFGILESGALTALKESNIVLIGTATCLEEAKILDEIGIDIITAQGLEAGGHRGTFLEGIPLPMIGSMSLIPLLSKNIQKPIVAAGGINDGKSIKAAFILGAKGVQIGTAFIGSDESLAIPSYKEALRNSNDTDTILTKSFSGRWARGLRNKFITEVEKSGIEIPAYPIQAGLVSPIRMEAQRKDNKEFAALWAGQSASTSGNKPAADIFNNLIEQVEGSG